MEVWHYKTGIYSLFVHEGARQCGHCQAKTTSDTTDILQMLPAGPADLFTTIWKTQKLNCACMRMQTPGLFIQLCLANSLSVILHCIVMHWFKHQHLHVSPAAITSICCLMLIALSLFLSGFKIKLSVLLSLTDACRTKTIAALLRCLCTALLPYLHP